MDNDHGITRELRSFTKDPLLGYASQSQHVEQLTAIADRIDAALAERYVELPKDADGVPIHLGDEVYQVEGGLVYTVESITFYPDNTTATFRCKYGFGCDSPHNVRHYHAPTVEDVLREMADRCYADEDEPRDRDAIVAEYAKRLTLRGDGE